MFHKLFNRLKRRKPNKKHNTNNKKRSKGIFRRTKLHFRKHLNDSNKHNVVVGGESKDKFAYMVNTHSEFSGHKKNLKLNQNTDPTHPDDPSFLVKSVETDKRNRFSEPIRNRRLSKEDKKVVSKWFSKNKLFKKK